MRITRPCIRMVPDRSRTVRPAPDRQGPLRAPAPGSSATRGRKAREGWMKRSRPRGMSQPAARDAGGTKPWSRAPRWCGRARPRHRGPVNGTARAKRNSGSGPGLRRRPARRVGHCVRRPAHWKRGGLWPKSATRRCRCMLKNELPPASASACYSSVRESDFVAPREEVLALYDHSYDARHPVIRTDEKPKQLLAENRCLRSLGFRHEPPVPGLAIRLPVPSRAMVEGNRRG